MSVRTIANFCRDGHLPYSMPDEIRPANGRLGPKSFRVRRADWGAFLDSRRFGGGTGKPPIAGV